MISSILCIVGPTGSGKTDLAVQLAARFPVEIISVDSAMVYRGMDIGTAKPSLNIRDKVTHHLIDICNPADSYSAGNFCRDATAAIAQITAKKRIPLLVGGTFLYFKSLLEGISTLPVANPQIRESLQKEAIEKGWDFLYERLKTVDPIAAARIHPNDKQRLQRALEVYEVTGKTLTEHLKHGWKQDALPYRVLSIALVPSDRTALHQRIQLRFDDMLQQGLMDEVRALRQNPHLTLDKPSMRSVGYRQVWQYLDGQIDKTNMREQALAATRQLAKRQMTWLKSWPEPERFETGDPQLLERVEEKIKWFCNCSAHFL